MGRIAMVKMDACTCNSFHGPAQNIETNTAAVPPRVRGRGRRFHLYHVLVVLHYASPRQETHPLCPTPHREYTLR